eukprot:scaffold3999_cov101-Isochrysis_galbana.AAC.3
MDLHGPIPTTPTSVGVGPAAACRAAAVAPAGQCALYFRASRSRDHDVVQKSFSVGAAELTPRVDCADLPVPPHVIARRADPSLQAAPSGGRRHRGGAAPEGGRVLAAGLAARGRAVVDDAAALARAPAVGAPADAGGRVRPLGLCQPPRPSPRMRARRGRPGRLAHPHPAQVAGGADPVGFGRERLHSRPRLARRRLRVGQVHPRLARPRQPDPAAHSKADCGAPERARGSRGGRRAPRVRGQPRGRALGVGLGRGGPARAASRDARARAGSDWMAMRWRPSTARAWQGGRRVGGAG